MGSEFSQVLGAIEPSGDSSSSVIVPPDWLQGRTVFGGLQMALAARAMRAALPAASASQPLRSAQMTFVGPLLGGIRVRLRGECLRTGKSTSHARCDLLHDDGKVASTVTAIFGGPRESKFVRELSRRDPGLAPEQAPARPLPPTLAPAFAQHFDMRFARGDRPFSGYAEPHSMIYVRLRDRECGAEDALLALADAIPTPVLSMLSEPAPASSINWMVEVLRDPARLDLHDWALLDTEVRAGTAGYLSQTSVLYGADRHAYSVSHQTVAVFG